jgi:hypothetical protein
VILTEGVTTIATPPENLTCSLNSASKPDQDNQPVGVQPDEELMDLPVASIVSCPWTLKGSDDDDDWATSAPEGRAQRVHQLPQL